MTRASLLLVAAVAAAVALAGIPHAQAATGQAESSRANSALDILLNLSGRREQALDAYVRAVSDPSSPRYRQYLSLRQLARRFGAPVRDKRRVLGALASYGLEGHADPSGSFVSVRLARDLAERLFSTQLVRAPAAGGVALRPLARPTLPAALAGLVDGVVGLDTRPVVRPGVGTDAEAAPGPGASGRERTGTPDGCPAGQQARSPLGIPGFTPNQWLTAYHVDRLHARGLTGSGQRLGLIEVDGYLESDLDAAGECFGYDPPPLRRILVGLDAPLAPGPETTLDLQMISATAPGLDEIQVYQGSSSLSGLLFTFLAPLEQPPAERPHVVSASLGACEPAFSDQAGVIEAGEQLFRVYAALGITLVASAGDTGSSGCSLEGNSSALAVPAVGYPASSAFVTGVGGTNLDLNAANEIVDEVVWNNNPILLASGGTGFGGAGGGGQSLAVGRPWWQRARTAVGPNRLVPDVAMLADTAPGYAIYCSVPQPICQPGGFISVGGTSAAAPLLAASTALANEAAERRGQPRLGFLNPLFYSIGSGATLVFHDVTQGTNDVAPFLPAQAGGGEPIGCCKAGIGWDRASGFGSVNAAAFEGAARAAYAAATRPRAAR